MNKKYIQIFSLWNSGIHMEQDSSINRDDLHRVIYLGK